jgi:hypothetical protein
VLDYEKRGGVRDEGGKEIVSKVVYSGSGECGLVILIACGSS